MAKVVTQYVCQSCGSAHRKWQGRCDGCGEWNTLVEETVSSGVPGGLGASAKSGKAGRVSFERLDGKAQTPPRRVTGIAEFDRVCGGGLVPGSAILIGGDPGIGKSTLLLQVAAKVADASARPTGAVAEKEGADAQTGGLAIYVSGEEAVDQVRMRAVRLGVGSSPVALAAATNVRDILAALDEGASPAVVIIDSIQTMFVDTLDSAPGSVGQVRASALELIRLAKKRQMAIILVGHVTKDGMIAGPKVLEHMVDTVLYFEGDRGHQFRILRAVKNRFGPGDEIGVFEMMESGLAEVPNPSALFLGDRESRVSGSAVFAGMEGTRPVLVEIQALLSPVAHGTPRRSVVGWDSSRLAMVMAVLEARCGVAVSGYDVYLNVAGGLRIAEPGADLAVAMALISSLTDRPGPAECIVFGEIGLSGEVRPVGQADARKKEAAKLGFSTAVVPTAKSKAQGKAKRTTEVLELREIGHLSDLLTLFGAEGTTHKR